MACIFLEKIVIINLSVGRYFTVCVRDVMLFIYRIRGNCARLQEWRPKNQNKSKATQTTTQITVVAFWWSTRYALRVMPELYEQLIQCLNLLFDLFDVFWAQKFFRLSSLLIKLSKCCAMIRKIQKDSRYDCDQNEREITATDNELMIAKASRVLSALFFANPVARTPLAIKGDP